MAPLSASNPGGSDVPHFLEPDFGGATVSPVEKHRSDLVFAFGFPRRICGAAQSKKRAYQATRRLNREARAGPPLVSGTMFSSRIVTSKSLTA